jgi:hypothetical protein
VNHQRRQVVCSLAYAGLFGKSVDAIASEMTSERIQPLATAWEQFGDHRTGTPAERQSALWLEKLLLIHGVPASTQVYSLQRMSDPRAHIEVNGVVIDGFPLSDGGTTGGVDWDGKLVQVGEEGDFALIEVSPNAEYEPEFVKLRESGRYRAIVAITKGKTPGLALVNAARHTRPAKVPVLQCPSTAAETLALSARQGALVKLQVNFTRVPSEGTNVVATIAGSSGALPPLVIATPRSGWWRSTGERFGGIYCWLQALKACAVARPDRTVIGVASSGHELGHLGMEDFERRNAGLAKSAFCWLHLGANIGARGSQIGIQSSSADWMSLLDAALSASSVPLRFKLGPGKKPFGEARNVFDAQGSYLSLLASAGDFFHQSTDRGPDAIDFRTVDQVARVVGETALRVCLSKT